VRAAVAVLLMIVRLCALVLVVLGIGFWSGHWLALVPAHMAIGVVLVACLLIIGISTAVARSTFGPAGAAIVWSAVVVWLGVTQQQLMPGSAHWIVQALHLLVGLGAAGLAERLARLAKTDSPGAGRAVTT
jgi:hypothetical protein